MAKKAVKEDRGPVEYKLFAERRCPYLNQLLDIYKTDKVKAKILFDNKKNSYSYSTTRDVLFEYPNGDFKIARLTRKFGMSKTFKIYHRESTEWALIYKNKRLYYARGSMLRQTSFNTLQSIMANSAADRLNDPKYNYLLSRFGWLRNVAEDERVHSLSFGVILTHKLFNVKKMLAHMYSVPFPIAEMVSKNQPQGYHPSDARKIWKQMKDVLINIENLKPELYTNHLFKDTCIMAASLGKKVNCSWGKARLKDEHDKWALEIVKVVMEFEVKYDLNIAQVYRDFAEFSGYEMLLTNHDLVLEGKMMRHCVGTYAGNVNSGQSAIYRINNHTLELGFRQKDWGMKDSPKVITFSQLKGYNNSEAPKELNESVKAMIDEFNKGIKKYPPHEAIYNTPTNHYAVVGDELPF